MTLSTLPLDKAARIGLRMDAVGRLFVRDMAIRAARERHHAGQKRTIAAKAIAADLVSLYRDASAAVPDEIRLALKLNMGHTLAWRQISNVLAAQCGWRGS